MESGFKAHTLCTGRCRSISKMEINVKYPGWIRRKALKKSRCHLRAKIWQYDSGGMGRPDLRLTTSGCEAAKSPTAMRWDLKVWKESKKWHDEIIERENILVVSREGVAVKGWCEGSLWWWKYSVSFLYQWQYLGLILWYYNIVLWDVITGENWVKGTQVLLYFL